jgi:hypothetical protein
MIKTRVSFAAATTLIMMCVAILTLATVFSFNPTTTTVVFAQAEPSPSPTPDEEKDRLQREADLATLKKTKSVADKDAAEAQKAELEARFPKPTTSPLEGKTTVEGAVIESQMIAYISLSRAADRIVDAIKDKFGGQNLAVYNEQDVNLMLNYKVATSQIDALVDKGYCKILTPAATNGVCPTPTPTGTTPQTFAVPSVLPIARSFLGAFVDFTALLRTNVEIKGQSFAVDEAPLVAEIFRSAKGERPLYLKPEDHFDSHKINAGSFYYPYVFPPDLKVERGSEILSRLEDVHKLRGNAAQLIDAIEKDSADIETLAAKIKDLKKAIGETLPQQSADAVALAGTLIKAHCRRLSADVDGIKQLPEQQQSPAMVNLINSLEKKCPRIDPDKLAQILGLGNVLTDTAKALEKAKTAQSKAETDKTQKEHDLTKDLESLMLTLPPNPTPDELKNAATAALAQLKQINTQFDNLVTALLQSQPGGTNPLTNYIKAERLNAALSEGSLKDNYWLQLKVINAGGNNRIKTNLLIDIFTGGNRLSHSGGVIVEYHLFNSNGKSLQAGTVSDYTDYIKANRIHGITGSKD